MQQVETLKLAMDRFNKKYQIILSILWNQSDYEEDKLFQEK